MPQHLKTWKEALSLIPCGARPSQQEAKYLAQADGSIYLTQSTSLPSCCSDIVLYCLCSKLVFFEVPLAVESLINKN